MRRLSVNNSGELWAALTESIAKSPEPEYLLRLHCVYLVSQNLSCNQVADCFGKDPRTIARWVHRNNQFGPKSLKNTGHLRSSKICLDNLHQLKGDLALPPARLGYTQKSWNANLLQVHLKTQYKVVLGIRQCQRLLRKYLKAIDL